MSVTKNLVLILQSDSMGQGDPSLGAKLTSNFLRVLFETGQIPDRIFALNSGVMLTTEGTPVREHLENFVSEGAKVLSCKTCLEFFKREDKLVVGEPTTMRDTVQAMLEADRLLTI